MLNQELANLLYEIGYFLEMEETPFKPQAYEKAAVVLENLKENIKNIYNQGGIKALEQIPGIGRSIARKIEEYIKTGEIKYYYELKSKIPVDIEGLTKVEGMGPKTIKTLYHELGIGNIKDLERAAVEHKIASLSGFGAKKEQNILESIKFLKKGQDRMFLNKALFKAEEIQRELRRLKELKQINVAGSLRRNKETVGDLDFLAVSGSPEKIMQAFVNLEGVIKVWGKGKTKSSVRLNSGTDADLRIVPEKSYGAALQYFTGSKAHNIALRKIAMEKGLKLSEYGLFKGKKMLAGKTEKEVYGFLGMDYIEPEFALMP